MKKLICVLAAVALLLCSLALCEGKTILPMAAEIDLSAPADGIYSVAFAPADLSEDALKFTIFTEDCYDIVDIGTLAPGDTIVMGGEEIRVESVEGEDDLHINGGLAEGGIDLRAYEEDNCWKAALEDDYVTWTERGEATLPLAEGVTFTDGWDIEKEPVTASGADAVAEAIHGAEMDSFNCANTTLRVEGGAIVEIVRSYTP